jgi:hypothetical protein
LVVGGWWLAMSRWCDRGVWWWWVFTNENKNAAKKNSFGAQLVYDGFGGNTLAVRALQG